MLLNAQTQLTFHWINRHNSCTFYIQCIQYHSIPFNTRKIFITYKCNFIVITIAFVVIFNAAFVIFNEALHLCTWRCISGAAGCWHEQSLVLAWDGEDAWMIDVMSGGGSGDESGRGSWWKEPSGSGRGGGWNELKNGWQIGSDASWW